MAIVTCVCFLLFAIVGYVYNIQRSPAFTSPVDHHFKVEQRHTEDWGTSTKCDEEIGTTRDARYVLYGDGPADEQTTKRLHNYIRSLTSRQAPGGVHLAEESESEHFSQIGQSEFVDDLLKGRRQGVFIECGAADGEGLSNSLFFELHRNWTGVLIEANPRYHRTLLSKNRNAYVVRACLSTTSKPRTVQYKLANFLSGISDKSDDPRSHNIQTTTDVQCFPLNSITAALGIQHVDYLSLDVEGAELDILSTVDWTQLSVDVITVEYNLKTDILKQLRSLLTANGTFAEVALLPAGSLLDSLGQDVVFMRTDQTPNFFRNIGWQAEAIFRRIAS